MKNQIKKLIIEFFYMSNLLKLILGIKELFNPGTYVLMFHRVSDGRSRGMRDITIDINNFKRLMNDLKKSFEIVSPEDFKRNSPARFFWRPRLLITIDDAYSELLLHAVPFMQENNIPFFMYPVTSYLDKATPFWWDVWDFALEKKEYELLKKYLRDHFPASPVPTEFSGDNFALIKTFPQYQLQKTIINLAQSLIDKHPGLRFDQSMNWEELKSLKKAEIGCHTMNHPTLPSLTSDQIHQELEGANQRLQDVFSVTNITMAFPAGLYNPNVEKVAAKFNYSYIFTTDQGRFTRHHSNAKVPRYNLNDEIVCDLSGKYSFSFFVWNLWRRETF